MRLMHEYQSKQHHNSINTIWYIAMYLLWLINRQYMQNHLIFKHNTAYSMNDRISCNIMIKYTIITMFPWSHSSILTIIRQNSFRITSIRYKRLFELNSRSFEPAAMSEYDFRFSTKSRTIWVVFPIRFWPLETPVNVFADVFAEINVFVNHLMYSPFTIITLHMLQTQLTWLTS